MTRQRQRYRQRLRHTYGRQSINQALQCGPRETPTEAEKLVRTVRSTGNDTQSSN
jgi:hypothetical protein